jgi:hypothetical protein
MLEHDGVLKTWRLPAQPTDLPRTALAIGDHRLAYLDYEGPVSGGRGTVKRWDIGTYDQPASTAGSWMVHLHGERWQGTATFTHEGEQDWTCHFEPVPPRLPKSGV